MQLWENSFFCKDPKSQLEFFSFINLKKKDSLLLLLKNKIQKKISDKNN